MKKLVLCLSLAAAITACTSDSPEDLQEGGSIHTNVEASKVNYTEHIKPILDQSCATSGCHNSSTRQSGFDFSNFDDVLRGFQNGNSISRMQNSSRPMPPSGTLPQECIDLVLNWKNNGFIENANTQDNANDDTSGDDASNNDDDSNMNNGGDNDSNSDNSNQDSGDDNTPAAVTYIADIKPIIDNNCSGCHTNGGKSGGLSLDSFSLAKTSFSNTTSDGSLNRIERTQGASGMMPRNGTRLSEATIQKVKDWIAGGFIEQ